MKLVSPPQRGTTCWCRCAAIPAPATEPRFIPRLKPCTSVKFKPIVDTLVLKDDAPGSLSRSQWKYTNIRSINYPRRCSQEQTTEYRKLQRKEQVLSSAQRLKHLQLLNRHHLQHYQHTTFLKYVTRSTGFCQWQWYERKTFPIISLGSSVTWHRKL